MAALIRDRRGATAVEFALVGLPFLAMLGAIIQFAFIIWAQQSLDFAFQKGVRSVFTGQFQTTNSQSASAATLLAALKTSICGTSTITVFDCSGIKLDLRLGTSFATTTPIAPVDPSTKDWATGFGTAYTCAPPGAIVIATAAAKFPVIFKLLNAGLADFADGSALLQSTQVFRTEPYGASTC